MAAANVFYFDIAEGQVDPAVRVANDEIEQSKVNELTSRIAGGEFTVQIDPNSIPCMCMDCRGVAGGGMLVGAKAAGGTDTMVVADALTTNSFRQAGESAPAHKRRVMRTLKQQNYPIGGHTANNVTNPKYGGCGAEDKLDGQEPDEPSILGYLTRKHEDLFDLMRSVGYEVAPELGADIVKKAAGLREESYAASGKELSEVGKAEAPEGVHELSGPQNAVLTVLMTKRGDVLDQEAIAKEYGDQYQVFEIETWAVENGAKATSTTPEEAHAKNIAGMAYNLSAGGVIVGSGMGVLVV